MVHTFPPLRKNKIELKNGIHNIINISVLKGNLKFNYEKVYDDKRIDYVLRKINANNIIYSDEVKNKFFLSNKYNLTVLTYPFKEERIKNIPIERGVHQFIKKNGKLIIDSKNTILATLYYFENKEWKIVRDFGIISSRIELKLQAAKYKLVYINKTAKYSDRTIIKNFEIVEKKTVLIN